MQKSHKRAWLSYVHLFGCFLADATRESVTMLVFVCLYLKLSNCFECVCLFVLVQYAATGSYVTTINQQPTLSSDRFVCLFVCLVVRDSQWSIAITSEALVFQCRLQLKLALIFVPTQRIPDTLASLSLYRVEYDTKNQTSAYNLEILRVLRLFRSLRKTVIKVFRVK